MLAMFDSEPMAIFRYSVKNAVSRKFFEKKNAKILNKNKQKMYVHEIGKNQVEIYY